jgi:molecular chaperone IbpA
MATLDFSPLVRPGIGFDQLANWLSRPREDSSSPPYNIEKISEDQCRVVMAVAGFGRDEIEIVQAQNRLLVTGHRPPDAATYLRHGLPIRAFGRQFNLADYVEVTDAVMGDGLQVITLRRELPEALKPRSIRRHLHDLQRQGDRTGDRGERPTRRLKTQTTEQQASDRLTSG